MSGLIKRLESLLMAGQDNLLLRFGLGKAYAEQHQYSLAIQHLERAIELDPSHSSSWFWLGRACFEDQQLKRAQSTLERTISVAQTKGDKQTVKMAEVFLRRTNKALES